MTVYFADFETTNAKLSLTETHVALWGIKEINKNPLYIGFSLRELFNNEIFTDKKVKIYFHNLNFDGVFLEHWLKENFKYGTDWKFIKTPLNKIYSIKFKYRKISFIIWDSLKVIPMSIGDIGKHFKFKKGQINYDLFNDLYLATDKKLFLKTHPKILEYLERDIDIIKQLFEKLSLTENITTSSTLSGLALNNFIDMGKYLTVHCNQFDKDVWDKIYLSYSGGFTQYNPKHLNKVIEKKLYYYDVNSLYPYIMSNVELPYGAPVYHRLPHKKYYKFILIEIYQITKKRTNMVSHFKMKEGIVKIKYIDDLIIDKPIIRCFTETELKELNLTYNIIYKTIQTFYFNKKVIFKEYIDKWYNIKKQEDKNSPIYLWAKLNMNALSGKMSQGYLRWNKEYDENNQIKIVMKDSNVLSPVHTGSAITSEARCYMLRLIRKYQDNFYYTDTDSIILDTPLPDKMVGAELGQFKLESEIDKLKIVRKKGYMYYNKDMKVVKLSGLKKEHHDKLNLNNFKIGHVIPNAKLYGTIVDGGIILRETDFTIKEI